MQTNYQKTYDRARLHLLVMIVLTMVNLIWLLFDASALSMFSAALPYMVTSAGVALYWLQAPLYLVILCGIAAVLLLGAYVFCWAFSKKRGGWLLTATILYAVDTVAMVFLVINSFVQAAAEGLLPNLFTTAVWTVFQIWMLVFFIRGTVAWRKMP